MKEPKDKRTKEYKEWKAKFEKEQATKPEGLGDVVENILHSKPIEPITNAIKNMLWKDGEDCGCDERKEKLNKIFTFKKPKCLNQDEYEFLTDFFSKRRTNVTFLQRQEMYTIYNRIFGTHLKNTSCPSCVADLVNKLSIILDTYKQ